MTKRTILLTLLGLLFAWTLSSQLSYSWWMVALQAESEKFVEIPFVRAQFSREIRFVSPVYSASGLRVGDTVNAINGKHIDGSEMEARIWHSSKPDDVVTVGVQRAIDLGAGYTFHLYAHHTDASEWPLTIITKVILPISCLLVGFWIAFARSTDPLAWITMAMLASISQLAGGSSAVSLATPWRELMLAYQSIAVNFWPVWMVLFGLYFPEPFPSIRRLPWLGWLIALPSVVLSGLDLYGNFMSLHHLEEIRWLARIENITDKPETIWFTLCVFTFFGCLALKGRTTKSPDARRRIRLMIAGCSLALTPSLPIALNQIGLVPAMPPLLEAFCAMALILFPFTMAYVIVVQRAMDVRMVVRSGVQYAFAQTGIRILQAVIMTVVVAQSLRLAREANRTVEEVTIASVGILLVISVRRLSESMRAWMDRRFFREAYSRELLLTDLSNSVAGIRSVRDLLETVTRRLSETMHVPNIAVFLERNGIYRPAYSVGSGQVVSAEFTSDAKVVQFLKQQRTASKVYFADPQSWIHAAPEVEQETLRHLETQLLLPLTLKSRLLGIISLGGKKSEEPYSRADLQLLSAVASQTGLALENAELTESMRREVAQRERLDRELEIAREVQQRLFPQKLPLVNGLDFAGYCRPAEGVGGDYYDFVHLWDKSLGIAIGDVSGKGIAAALMMASLQASLRGQTIKPCETLSEMIQHINGLMYEASAANRYATFFYAQYDPSTLAMRYVNAGHNPPIVWRSTGDTHEFIRLEDGGTVVGLFPDCPFREGLVQLQKGDVLVAFTDGISEAMNSADEEFEEERLMEALKKLQARTAAEMISQLLTEVDAFTAGAKQHDDMTLVIVRVQ